MKYNVVKLEEKMMVGLAARTANDDPKMGEIIGGLWQKLFAERIFFAIGNKVNDRSIGLYSDYANSAHTNTYDITVGCEVSGADSVPKGTMVKRIPAGNYAEFVVQGDDIEAVGKLWGEIWNLPLERTYTGDFEEYYTAPDGTSKEIHIYIAIQ